MAKKRLEDMTERELNDTYRREVMSYQIREVRRRKKGQKVYNTLVILLGVLLLLFFIFGGQGLNTVGT